MIYAFTSCALNYTPKSRLLLRSLREHAPDVKICLALGDRLDGFEEELAEQFDHVYPITDFPELSDPAWIYRHQIVELCTAIKPFVLRKILERDDCEGVFYFDPDMVLFSDIEEMINDLRNNDILLTPHLTDPEKTIRGIEDNELSALRHGTYNLGYVGVRKSDEGIRFADWWSARLKRWCREDIPAGIFTDQKWIDLVPGFFENVKILRHPGYNVASWNMTNREITKNKKGKYLVNGKPLVFYHFTGFDSGAHVVMANIYSKGNDAVTELVKWYKDSTDKLGEDSIAKVKWAYTNYDDGSPISGQEREVYRTRNDLQTAFPNPFATDGGDGPSFKQWWDVTGKREYNPEEFEPADATAPAGAVDTQISAVPAEAKRAHPLIRIPRGFLRFIFDSTYRKAIKELFSSTYRFWGVKGIFGLFFGK